MAVIVSESKLQIHLQISRLFVILWTGWLTKHIRESKCVYDLNTFKDYNAC